MAKRKPLMCLSILLSSINKGDAKSLSRHLPVYFIFGIFLLGLTVVATAATATTAATTVSTVSTSALATVSA